MERKSERKTTGLQLWRHPSPTSGLGTDHKFLTTGQWNDFNETKKIAGRRSLL